MAFTSTLHTNHAGKAPSKGEMLGFALASTFADVTEDDEEALVLTTLITAVEKNNCYKMLLLVEDELNSWPQLPFSTSEFFGLIFWGMLLVEDNMKTEEYMNFHQAFINECPTIAQIWMDELEFDHGLSLYM